MQDPEEGEAETTLADVETSLLAAWLKPLM